jgi:hypothetical protein
MKIAIVEFSAIISAYDYLSETARKIRTGEVTKLNRFTDDRDTLAAAYARRGETVTTMAPP